MTNVTSPAAQLKRKPKPLIMTRERREKKAFWFTSTGNETTSMNSKIRSTAAAAQACRARRLSAPGLGHDHPRGHRRVVASEVVLVAEAYHEKGGQPQ